MASSTSDSTYGGRGSSLQHSDVAKIFVGGLSWQTTEESLRWHFEQYGTVVSVEVMRDRNTGDPRGFAFVVFADTATVDLVMVDKDKHEINHKLVDVKRAQARGVAPPSIHESHRGGGGGGNRSDTHNAPQQQSGGGGGDTPSHLSPEQMHAKVFVGGIPPHVDRDELKRIFTTNFGAVTDAIVMLDQATQRSRCFGFVTFQNPSSAAAAVAAQPVAMHGRNVEVKLATPRADNPSQTHHHHHRMPPAPKHVGLRAGQAAATATGEFAGLAVAFGRSGWKAGYGTKAFGSAGWNIWEDTGGPPPEKAGFSFAMLDETNGEPPVKRARH